MPKLPVNMVTRKGRPGYYFRRKENGKTRWLALGDDFVEAKRLVRKLRGAEVTRVSELTVAAAARRWLDGYVRNARTESGRKLAAVRVATHLEPALGYLLLHRVNKEHIRGYRVALEAHGLSPQTVAHLLSDARCFFNRCVEDGLLDRSPWPSKIMPRISEVPPPRLSDEEANTLRGLPGPHGFVCRLALETGLRWGELVRCQASDIERGFLVVHHQTKSGKVRRIPLGPEILAEVRTRVGRLAPFAANAPGSFSRTVRRNCGIADFHVHRLRHTFACQWLERGGSLPALQQILGHASIETTQRYARLSDEAVMAEAVRIGSHGVARGVASAS